MSFEKEKFVYCAAPIPLGDSGMILEPMPFKSFQDIPIPEDERNMLHHFINQAAAEIQQDMIDFITWYYQNDHVKAQAILIKMHASYQKLGPAYNKVIKKINEMKNEKMDCFKSKEVKIIESMGIVVDNFAEVFDAMSHLQSMIHNTFSKKIEYKD